MILDDNPAREDLFEFSRFVKILTTIIDDVDSTPFVIGILGAWGCGKTTLMKHIQTAAEAKYKTIWFNPWKYDNKESIWNAFIQSILSSIKLDLETADDDSRKDLIKRIQELGKKLTWYSFKVGANKLTGGLLSDDLLENLKKTFETNEEPYEFINKFEVTFSKLIQDYCGDSKLIIFIDDLDRCVPENAITVLESIKLFLDRSNCIFILGLEKEIVEKGIHHRYKKEIDFSGKDYLEKIIQLPFNIPPVTEASIRTFIKTGKLAAILPEDRREEFVDIIINGTGGNLRKIKRFLNNFLILKMLLNLAPTDWTGHGLLAKILILQMRYPKLHREISRRSDLLESITTKIADGKIDLHQYCEKDDVKSVEQLRQFLIDTSQIENLSDRIDRITKVSNLET
jgi:predicted KAP-like P-loop ATPase